MFLNRDGVVISAGIPSTESRYENQSRLIDSINSDDEEIKSKHKLKKGRAPKKHHDLTKPSLVQAGPSKIA